MKALPDITSFYAKRQRRKIRRDKPPRLHPMNRVSPDAVFFMNRFSYLCLLQPLKL
nr:MAG TPA: hypothetical protein [Caudoviricetes sp.]